MIAIKDVRLVFEMTLDEDSNPILTVTSGLRSNGYEPLVTIVGKTAFDLYDKILKDYSGKIDPDILRPLFKEGNIIMDPIKI